MDVVTFSLYAILAAWLLIVLVYGWYFNRLRYWRRKGVQGPRPTLIFGNMLELFGSTKQSLGTRFAELYAQTKHRPYAGIYLFHRPALLVNDPELIKTIFVRDFDHFVDHGLDFDKRTQPLVHHLHNLNGDRWRAIRAKLTSAFTSSKLKQMHAMTDGCRRAMMAHLDTLVGLQYDRIDVKEVVAKCTTDVIVTCAFGIESDSFVDPVFRNKAKDVFAFDLRKKVILLTALFAPDLQKIFNGKVFDDDLTGFFIGKIEQLVKQREESGVERNDIMQTLIKLKNEEKQMTLLEITAIAFGLFLGGFETASNTCTFIFYELAKNQDVQNKLRSEIRETLERNRNQLTYETLVGMTYMNQVINETLRKYPPIPQLFRLCTKDYTIPQTNIVIEKGTPVYVSALGIHRDPEIHPEPERFSPERFSPEQIKMRHNFSFIPFGEGPRMCIGNMFAMMQIRSILTSILRLYRLDVTGDGSLDLTRNSLLLMPNRLNLKLTKC